jgi:hypothetical protein
MPFDCGMIPAMIAQAPKRTTLDLIVTALNAVLTILGLFVGTLGGVGLLALPGCKSGADDQTIVLKRLTLTEEGALPSGRVRFTSGDFRQFAEKAARAHPRYKLLAADVEGPEGAFIAQMSLDEVLDSYSVEEGRNGLRTDVTVTLKLNRTDPDGNLESFAARATATHFAPGLEPEDAAKFVAPHKALMEEAVRRALDKALVQIEQSAFPIDKLIADLQSADPEVRDSAVQELGERKDPRSFDALVKALADSDERVVRRAIGALEQLGDPRALLPLIDASRVTDAADAMRLIDLGERLGGADAFYFLAVIAEGHQNTQVRERARRALEKVDSNPPLTGGVGGGAGRGVADARGAVMGGAGSGEQGAETAR